MGKRAKGRSLAEFSPLNAAEKRILEAAAAGGAAVIGETRPDAPNESNTVRADFLRFLALGGDDEAPVHETGLWVQGAWITGTLDLSGAEIAGGLLLTNCQFEQTPALFDTQIRGAFSLAGSKVPGLNADRLTCHSGLFLRNEFLAKGEIRLSGATIGGDLDCSGGILERPQGAALSADGIKVGGNVFMGKAFSAQGEIRLLGATITLNLECRDGKFVNPEGPALTAEGIKVGGNIFMGKAFGAQGEIRLLGAEIGGDLNCRGGSFGKSDKIARAINCQGMRVSGALVFDPVKICGMVDLTACHVAHLIDDTDSWPENIALDGFVYDRFAGDAPTTAKDRLAWLDRQHPKHSGKAKNPREFRPQPWVQLRKVLRDMGHFEDARQVAIAFEDRKRFCRVIGEISEPATAENIGTALAQWLQSRTARGFHFLYGALIGYGFRPARLFWIVVAVWAFSSLLFDIGGHSRVFGPTDPQIFENSAYDPCNPEKNPRANWTRCQTFPRAYPAFYPPLYALDVLLPIAKLGQQDHWAPLAPGRALTTKNWLLAWATQIAVWFDMMSGWIAGLLLIATVSGLAKRQDD
ncbi:hypothetical protein [Acidibrevibacterium fodinaquatile]|uniref:hypothetical protein n=1 Tax=Acidibrevibacterium fodinaquatile TaxID=1969806 RepID=UPI000E0CCF44|nr:hypothetical protein [Acidibrevibacterium fodinaquatile]